jgi:hypothetical protein
VRAAAGPRFVIAKPRGAVIVCKHRLIRESRIVRREAEIAQKRQG